MNHGFLPTMLRHLDVIAIALISLVIGYNSGGATPINYPASNLSGVKYVSKQQSIAALGAWSGGNQPDRMGSADRRSAWCAQLRGRASHDR